MASPWTFTFLCGLLGATLVQATLSPPVTLIFGPEVIKQKLTQELESNDASAILQELPLLSAVREQPTLGLPLLDSLVNGILKHAVWLKVTSAYIHQLQVQPSDNDQELALKIPLHMVAGFNTPLVKTIIQFHMETEVEALVGMNSSEEDPARMVLSDCSSSPGSLHISLLNKFSFLVNSLANTVMNLLVPALPDMVKTQLCPVIQTALNDMYADLLQLGTAPISLRPGQLQFGPLSVSIKSNSIEFSLWAKLLDSQAKVTKQFSNSVASLVVTIPDGAPFSLTVRQDVVNAVVAEMLPPRQFLVLVYYVLPDLARELKSSIQAINKKAADKLGPTQMVKIMTQNTPQLLLGQGNATVAQQIVLEVLATNQDLRPLFTLGIEASLEAQFYAEGDRLMLNLNDISFDRIHLLLSDMDLFNPELLKDILAKILFSTLLPNENGNLRTGVLVPVVKALGYKAAKWSVTKGALVLTPATS